MKIKTIALLLLIGLLTACTAATPKTLPVVNMPLSASPNPSQSQVPHPSYTPTARATQTSVPTVALASEVNPVLERVAQMGGSITGITIVGDLAYVGMGPRLAAIDISQHEHPRLLSQSEPLPGLVTQILQISDGLLLVSAGKYLVSVETSKPDPLKLSQQLELRGGITAMVFDDRTNILYASGAIYIASGSMGYDGLITAVILTPDLKLNLMNSVAMPEIPLCLAMGEGSVFAGANGEEGGLYQIKVKNSGELSTPQQIIASTPEMPLVPTSMQVIGDRLYLGYWGVDAYDITSPEKPIKIWAGSAKGINIVTDFTIDGDQLYVAGFLIKEPDLPVYSTFTAPDPIRGSPKGRTATNTAMHKGDFIVADKNFKIFDITKTQNLRLVGSYRVSVTNPIDAVANESAVFVVDNGIGDGQSNSILWVLSLPDLQPLGQVTTEIPNSSWEGLLDIALEGDQVYLATKDAIWVYGISISEPVLLGKVMIDEEQLVAISALKQGEKRLLFTLQSTEDKYNVLWVYNLTDLQKPTRSINPLILDRGMRAQMTWTGSALNIFLETSYFSEYDMLYAVGFYNDTLELIDSVALTGYTDHQAANDNLIVLTGTSISMKRSTVSVVKSETLKLLSTLTLPEDGMGVAIIGETSLVVVGGTWDWGGEAQLLIIDLRSPLEPRQVDAMDMVFSDNYNVPILYSSPYVILVNGAGGVDVLEYSHTIEPTFTPSPALTPLPTSTPSPTTTPPPMQASEHRIGIRYVEGLGEFYDRVDNSKFVPRGMNYARIDHIVDGKNWHSTFDPVLYDSTKIDQALSQMESDGYNVVRVFIDCCSAAGEQVGSPSHGLSYPYMENVVDFLWRAKAHHIYVILITDLIAAQGGYEDLYWYAVTPEISANNARYLTIGGSLAKANYETDFVRVLIELNAPMDAIFAYDLTNEVSFDRWEPPFSLSDGLVRTGNGKTYDMSKPEDKERMAIENLIYWIEAQGDSIRRLDPTALVELSFFSPLAPIPSQPGDLYTNLIGAVITQSQADFVDLHPYPGKGFTLEDYVYYYGITKNTPKPILMGEFGAFMYDFDTAASAALFLQNWQIESCQYGFDGWLFWTWDTEGQLWNALSQNHEIDKALSPTYRPDPCQ